jgi:hypothetical protein
MVKTARIIKVTTTHGNFNLSLITKGKMSEPHRRTQGNLTNQLVNNPLHIVIGFG